MKGQVDWRRNSVGLHPMTEIENDADGGLDSLFLNDLRITLQQEYTFGSVTLEQIVHRRGQESELTRRVSSWRLIVLGAD